MDEDVAKRMPVSTIVLRQQLVDVRERALVLAALSAHEGPLVRRLVALGLLFGGDLRRFGSQVMRLVGKLFPGGPSPSIPGGSPIFAWYAVSSSDEGYEMQISVDLAGVAELAEAMPR